MKLIRINSLLLLPLLFLLFDVSAETDTSVSPMLATEKEALYSLIQAFVGSSLNISQMYPDPCGWTPIQGVSCDLFDGFWYVTGVTIGPIHENSLDCAQNAGISNYIFEFKHLKSLSFCNCFRRTISIPSQNWEKLAASLQTLEFRSNPGITGEIPIGFSSLTNLESLVLIENRVTGELPASLGNLGKLKQLVVADNRISGQIPASLGGLSELLILDFGKNYLSGSVPSTFGGLVSLLKLDLSSNYLDGKIPLEIGKLRNLTLLDLRNNKFSGGLPQSLQEMVSLEEMLLANNPIGGILMEFGWRNLKNLIVMDLSNTSLIGRVPESMVEMRNLRFLALDNNHLSGYLSPKLAALPCLNALHLSGNNLSGELQFPEEFCIKLGRRFSVWNNPYLCFPVGFCHAPLGLKQCEEKEISVSSSSVLKTDIGGRNSNQAGTFSLEFSGSAVGGFWRDSFAEKMVIFVLSMLVLIEL